MTHIEGPLRRSVATMWREGLASGNLKSLRHWKSKIGCFQAFSELVEQGEQVTGEAITAKAGISLSNFYNLAGGNATHALIKGYDVGFRELYGHGDVMRHLGREALVEAYWPYRDSWLRIVETGEVGRSSAAEGVVLALAAFTMDHRALSAAVGGEPPICAVEDLGIVLSAASPRFCFNLLSRVVNLASRGLHTPPDVVLSGVQAELSDQIRPLERARTALPALFEAIQAIVRDSAMELSQQVEVTDLLLTAVEKLGGGDLGSSSAA